MAFNPAGNLSTSSQFTHFISTYYDRVALKPLRKQFLFWMGCDDRVMPLKNGKTIQFYRYSNLGANLNTTPEGTTGTASEMAGSTTVSATVSQYADFTSLSDMLVDTAMDGDIVAVASDQLGYRAGLTFDTIVRNVADASSGSTVISLLGDYLSGADLANIRHRFRGLDIKGFKNGRFPTIVHPYVSYDLIHDPSVGGFMDINKNGPSAAKLQNLPETGPLVSFNNCDVYESTNVTVTSGSPNTYRCYFFGQEGIAAIDLAGRGPTRTKDQDQMAFKIHVQKNLGPSLASPEGKIRAFCSYNVVFVAKLLDTTNYRLRLIDAPTSLGL
jgi:N4-gp56 family major capsid protein